MDNPVSLRNYISIRLECPLNSGCWDCIEAPVYEVVRQLNLGTDAQVKLLATLDRVEVKPQLWLGEKNEICALPCTVLTPEIDKTDETQIFVSKSYAPNTCDLEVVNRFGVVRDDFVRCGD